MNSEPEIECRATISQHLKALSALLVPALQRIISGDLASAVTSLRFEFESPHFDDGFPVMYWFVDQSGNAITVQEVLPELSHTIPESVIYDPKYESDGLDTWAITSELFFEWFADCWRDAGGLSFSKPAYLAHHDSIYSFDLIHRVHIKQAE